MESSRGAASKVEDADPELLGPAVDWPTVTVGSQVLALPVDRVRDVFVANGITGVSLSSYEIVGLLNLRGRVVTAVFLRRRPGLPDDLTAERRMAAGLEHRGEAYGLLVDEISEILKLDPAALGLHRGALGRPEPRFSAC